MKIKLALYSSNPVDSDDWDEGWDLVKEVELTETGDYFTSDYWGVELMVKLVDVEVEK